MFNPCYKIVKQKKVFYRVCGKYRGVFRRIFRQKIKRKDQLDNH